MRLGASLSVVVRRYGVTARLLIHWKQEQTAITPAFNSVEIADSVAPAEGRVP